MKIYMLLFIKEIRFGKVTFSLDGQELSSVDLVASSDVDKNNLFTMSKKIIYSWIDLLRS